MYNSKMKEEFVRLKTAVEKFEKSVGDFPVGAISIKDFLPVEIQIENLQDSVKQLDRRIDLSHTKLQSLKVEGTVKDGVAIVKKLDESTMKTILCDKFTKLCLHSDVISKVLSDVDSNNVLNRRIHKSMHDLYGLNEETIALQEKLTNAYQQQLELKIECRQAMLKHKVFLDEQAEIRAKNKKSKSVSSPTKKVHKKMEKLLSKVNIMKRLITTLIATSESMLLNPASVEMLASHRKLLNMEQLAKVTVEATDET